MQKPSVDAPIKEQTDKDLIIVYRDIDMPLFYDINQGIKERKKKINNRNCVLFLTTHGGDPNAGYRIAKCLQKNYDHIRLAVVSYCKSAGTLISLAANEIAFSDLGELGPLDIQVSKQDEVGAQASSLDIIEAMEAISSHMRKTFAKSLIDIRFGTKISTRLAGDLAAQLTSNVAAPLYSQIDPQRVAEMQRAMSIALKYGNMLAEKSKNLKKDSLHRLVTDYPTHSFVIDKDEAANLFVNVVDLSSQEEIICDKLWKLVKGTKQGNDGGPFIESFLDWAKDDDVTNTTNKHDSASSSPNCASENNETCAFIGEDGAKSSENLKSCRKRSNAKKS
ncbi:MAG: hypothetical protein IKC44_05150 [Burkholderiaceae bacterium]|nr:hypothetical protein [Burkholderiaceae bacterium]